MQIAFILANSAVSYAAFHLGLHHLLKNMFTSIKNEKGKWLTLNVPFPSKVVCFSSLLKCLRSSMANSVDPDQTTPIGAVCSGSNLFASILNSSVI